jgi:hypothetical protein
MVPGGDHLGRFLFSWILYLVLHIMPLGERGKGFGDGAFRGYLSWWVGLLS